MNEKMNNIEKRREINKLKMREYRKNNPKYHENNRRYMELKRKNNPDFAAKERLSKMLHARELWKNPDFRKKSNERNHQRRFNRKKFCMENNICFNKTMSCNEKRLPTHTMCEFHIFEEYAHRHLKNDSRWKELKDLFYSQNQECYLSGKKLILGINASLDHIIPISKGGSFDDIKNLAWMDEPSNYAKNNLSNEEFILLCNRIAKRHPMEVLD